MKFAFLLLAFSFVNCTEGLCSSADAASQKSTNHVVEIKQFAFLPSTLQVKAGDTITWINRDIVPHTATSKNDEWDTGTLMQNESRTLSVSAAMQADYFCRFHINMTASISID